MIIHTVYTCIYIVHREPCPENAYYKAEDDTAKCRIRCILFATLAIIVWSAEVAEMFIVMFLL